MEEGGFRSEGNIQQENFLYKICQSDLSILLEAVYFRFGVAGLARLGTCSQGQGPNIWPSLLDLRGSVHLVSEFFHLDASLMALGKAFLPLRTSGSLR